MSDTIARQFLAGVAGRGRQCTLAAVLSVTALLGACEPQEQPGVIGTVTGFAGAVVADEPRAATIGRDVLTAGGSAADAAVATYFALSVTMPSTAGLGGGGVCLAHDYGSGETTSIEFLPRGGFEGIVAVPSNVRGMAALHARFGKLPWAQLLGAAEGLARFGTPLSRATAKELESIGVGLLADPEMALVFGNGNGGLLTEGQPLVQAQLAATLARIRQGGGGALYVGQFARNFAEAAQSIGAPLSLQSLQGTVPSVTPALGIEFGNHIFYVPDIAAAGGITTAQIVGMLEADGGFDGSEADRARLMAQATRQAFAGRHAWLGAGGIATETAEALLSKARIEQMEAALGSAPPAGVAGPLENAWSTGFVTADRNGNMVACTVTMNALFGARRMVPGSGIILAPAPNEQGVDYYALGPALLANPHNRHAYFAGAASGGEAGISALANVFLRVAEADQPLDVAMLAKRLHHNGTPDTVFYEPGLDAASLSAAQQAAATATQAGALGRVNAIWCPETLRNGSDSCRAEADPRTFGLAILVGE